jgi:hypothetical protein
MLSRTFLIKEKSKKNQTYPTTNKLRITISKNVVFNKAIERQIYYK